MKNDCTMSTSDTEQMERTNILTPTFTGSPATGKGELYNLAAGILAPK